MEAGHPDVHVDRAGPQGEHGLRARQQHRHPARPIVRPGQVGDIGPADAQDRGKVLGERLLHRPGPDERRGGEGQPGRNLADLDQARPAFLDEHLGQGRFPAGLQPGVAGAQGRMTGERQLAAGSEDPDLVVRLLSGWRQHERGLGQVGPVGEALHLTGGQPVGVEDDGDRIAPEGPGGEDINFAEAALHTSESAIARNHVPGPPAPPGRWFPIGSRHPPPTPSGAPGPAGPGSFSPKTGESGPQIFITAQFGLANFGVAVRTISASQQRDASDWRWRRLGRCCSGERHVRKRHRCGGNWGHLYVQNSAVLSET